MALATVPPFPSKAAVVALPLSSCVLAPACGWPEQHKTKIGLTTKENNDQIKWKMVETHRQSVRCSESLKRKLFQPN